MSEAKKPKIIPLKNEPLNLDCEWETCSFNSTTMSSFLDHITSHLQGFHNDETEDPGDYRCSWTDCGHVASSHNEIVRHIYFHAFHVKIKCIGSNLLERYNLEGCSFGNQTRNMIPELPERLQCGWEECESVYDNPELFYRHVYNHAEIFPEGNHPEGGIDCTWNGCSSHVRSKHKLKDHLRSHTQEKLTACPTCGGLFASRIKFFDHVKRQASTELQSFQCSHCSKKFPSERLLRNHMRQHVNHYKCQYCEMTCPSPYSLQNHIKYRHSDEKPYPCEYCEYSCKSNSDLQRHLDTHNDDLAYSCHIEGCSFSSRVFASLSKHFRQVHEGESSYRYVCHLCNIRYIRGNFLTKHLMSVHKFVWPPGHTRFRYKLHDDGFYRLQTVRYESIVLTELLEDGNQSKENESSKECALPSEDSTDLANDVETAIQEDANS